VESKVIMDYFLIGNTIAEYWEPFTYLRKEQNLDINYDREWRFEYDKDIQSLLSEGKLVISHSRSNIRYLSLYEE